MKSTPELDGPSQDGMASSWSSGGPQIPGPVMRMAPKASR